MVTPSQNKTRRVTLWVAVATIALIVVAVVTWDIGRRAMGMRAATTSAATVTRAIAGAHLKFVCKLLSQPEPTIFDAQVLESSDGKEFQEANTRIRVILTGRTAVVMGGASDIKAGAIVQVDGVIASNGALEASQIVILSGFVRVQSGS